MTFGSSRINIATRRRRFVLRTALLIRKVLNFKSEYLAQTEEFQLGFLQIWNSRSNYERLLTQTAQRRKENMGAGGTLLPCAVA
jgi:hypothetical protein